MRLASYRAPQAYFAKRTATVAVRLQQRVRGYAESADTELMPLEEHCLAFSVHVAVGFVTVYSDHELSRSSASREW
jgi:hypothetical protein